MSSVEDSPHTKKEKVQLLDPIKRMRSERRVALIILNLLLLVAALMQVLGYAVKGKHTVSTPEMPAIQMELPK